MMSKDLKAKARMKFADSKFRKDFLEMCLKEVEREGYSGCSLKNVSWNRMIQELKLKCNKECSQKQLKNQWDYLKRCYIAWRLLVKKADNAYNEETGTFDWPAHVWDDIIQKYPDTRKYRNKPLEERDLFKTVFEPTVNTCAHDTLDPTHSGDNQAFNPSQPLAEPIPLSQHKIEEDENGIFEEVEPLNRVAPYESYVTGCNFYGALTNPTPEQGEKSESGSSCYLKRRKRESFEDPLAKRVDDLIEIIKGDSDEKEKEKEKILDKCLAKMTELMSSGVLEVELYMKGLKAFCDNLEYRKLFLKIDTDELKVLFVKTIAEKA